MEAWPKAGESLHYLDELLFSGRPERHGFTEEIWMELTFLNELLQLEYPSLPSDQATDIWAMALESGFEKARSAA